jgi:uncharacterized protein (TIGR03083 family)
MTSVAEPNGYGDEIAAYVSARERIMSLVGGLDDAQLATTVPCCPRWTVKELVGHLTGVAEDRRDGRMPVGGFEEWTDEQVARHQGETVDRVLASWAAFEPERSDAPPSLAALSFDVVTHEHDLCHAVSAPFDRDTESVRVGAQRAVGRIASVLEDAGAPGLMLRTEDGERQLDGNGRFLGLSADRLDIMLLVTGRMSERQAMALKWDDDPGQLLGLLFADGFFSLQPTDVLEADER